MLPQPNFDRHREPAKGAPETETEPDARPRKVRRLQIAMWIQVVSAILAGNLLLYGVFTYRSASLEDIRGLFEDADYTGVTGSAQSDYDYYQSTSFLVSYVTIGGIILLIAVIAALCTLRFKTRLKAVRWTTVATTAFLFIVGMFMSTSYSYLVAPWVFASVFALWWLFSRDIRDWMSETQGSKA